MTATAAGQLLLLPVYMVAYIDTVTQRPGDKPVGEQSLRTTILSVARLLSYLQISAT